MSVWIGGCNYDSWNIGHRSHVSLKQQTKENMLAMYKNTPGIKTKIIKRQSGHMFSTSRPWFVLLSYTYVQLQLKSRTQVFWSHAQSLTSKTSPSPREWPQCLSRARFVILLDFSLFLCLSILFLCVCLFYFLALSRKTFDSTESCCELAVLSCVGGQHCAVVMAWQDLKTVSLTIRQYSYVSFTSSAIKQVKEAVN